MTTQGTAEILHKANCPDTHLPRVTQAELLPGVLKFKIHIHADASTPKSKSQKKKGSIYFSL